MALTSKPTKTQKHWIHIMLTCNFQILLRVPISLSQCHQENSWGSSCCVTGDEKDNVTVELESALPLWQAGQHRWDTRLRGCWSPRHLQTVQNHQLFKKPRLSRNPGLVVPTRTAAGLLHSSCSCLGAYETGGSSSCVTSANLHQTEIKWQVALCCLLSSCPEFPHP